jgi:hypothetical protein
MKRGRIRGRPDFSDCRFWKVAEEFFNRRWTGIYADGKRDKTESWIVGFSRKKAQEFAKEAE